MTIDLTSLIKDWLLNYLVKDATAAVLAFFALSPTGMAGIVVAKIVSHVAAKIYPWFIKRVKVGSIILSNDLHQKLFENAQVKLKVIAMEKGIDSKEFQDAHENERTKFFTSVERDLNPLVVRIGQAQ